MLRKTNVFPTARQKRPSFASSLTLSNPAKDGAVTRSHCKNTSTSANTIGSPFLGPAIRASTACSRYRPSKEVLNPPKRPYAPPARAWGHHRGAVPGAAEPEDLADIKGGHYPPAVALTRARKAYLVLYIMVIRAYL